MLGIPNDISKEESVWKVAPSALTPTPTPTPTSSLIHTLETPLQVACGLDLTLILHDGVVFSCGWAADGQTGQGTDQDTICLSPIAFSVEPKDIAVSTARSNSDLGKASSTLVAATAADNKPPLYQIKQVSTRADCSFALLEILNSKQRLLYTWGNSEYGQTSLGKKNDKVSV